jgi:hypothetical protein
MRSKLGTWLAPNGTVDASNRSHTPVLIISPRKTCTGKKLLLSVTTLYSAYQIHSKAFLGRSCLFFFGVMGRNEVNLP